MKSILAHIEWRAFAFIALTPEIGQSCDGSNILAKAFCDSGGNIGAFINGLFQVVIVIGAMLAIIRIVWAGYLYMTSDSFTDKGASKGVLRDAIFGLLLLLSIFLILKQINPAIVRFDKVKLDSTPILPAPSGSAPQGTTD